MTHHNPQEDAPVDINQASRDELMEIPEVTGQLADRIIENRPYRNPRDIECLFADQDPRLEEMRKRFRFPEGAAPEASAQREPEGEERYE